MLDLDQFEERAAICEFDGGMTRFAAETAAAKEQGVARWQAMQEVRNAQRVGIAGGSADQADGVARQRDANDMPGLQRASEEKARSVPEREPEAGRDRGELLSLRVRGGQEVQR